MICRGLKGNGQKWVQVSVTCQKLGLWWVLLLKREERLCERSEAKVCFQCVRLAEIVYPSLAHEICMLGWWYCVFLTFVAKIATIPSISLFIWNKEFAKHFRENRDMLYITVIHLPLCYFYVCSDGLSVKVFAFKSIQLTSQHDSHLLYTRHVYRHLLSCCREWVPRFSYDETRGWRICLLVSKYTAAMLLNKNGEENGFFNWQYYFIWYPLGSSQGPLLMVTMPSPMQDRTTNLEKGKIIACPPSHPVSQT